MFRENALYVFKGNTHVAGHSNKKVVLAFQERRLINPETRESSTTDSCQRAILGVGWGKEVCKLCQFVK